MTKLTIIANIIAKEDKIDLIKTELLKLIDITLAETGCFNYDLHQDNENPTHFVFYEKWETRELWQSHMGGKHLQDFVANTEGALELLTVNEMTKIA
jgi:quinol monooxygenase YgiN